MSTSFVVNLNDLNKILEQIKIAERHAAGESLVDIIGADSSLLPMGLRTVDGSYNHLLPGQERVGAADEIFSRLLTPVYINEQDGDAMPLGPPGAPVVTNTNYDPTIPVVPGGVHSHSVADADPRIISNLIVDQTLNNRSALIAAIERISTPPGSSMTPGNSTAAETADLILAARDAAAAAAPFAAATAAAYATAMAQEAIVQSKVQSALAALTALRTDGSDGTIDNAGGTPASSIDGAAAIAALTDALAAANLMSAALQAPGTTVTAAEKLSASEQVSALTDLLNKVNAVQATASGGIIVPEFNAIVVAQSAAQDLVTSVQATATELADSAANPAGSELVGLLEEAGLELSNDGSLLIENRSPDVGLSPGNSAWMTFFGQFFDHGLDLVTKGGNGTIYMPLQPDDPLIAGADHVFGTADDLAPELRFMTLSRTTPFGANGTEAQNTTTPFVDQNQTYTSNASHQVFLREYRRSDAPIDIDHDGDLDNVTHTVNTGRLLNGAHGGIANWAEVKAQSTSMLGLKLSDIDVLDVPELEVDAYGNLVLGPHGYAQVHVTVRVVDTTTGNTIGSLPGKFSMEGVAGGLDLHNLPAPGNLPALPSGQSYVASIVTTGHAFLNDIAHDAVPVVIGGQLQPDANNVVNAPGTILPNDGQGHNLQYDDEMLNSHFVTGDGRGNENIGLTAVHTIFHSEHNRLVEANKATILASGDLAIINEWLTTDITQLPQNQAQIDALDWDGSRLFQAARFVTEMQYQHLVFEEFARRVQPLVDPFVFTNSADLNPAIIAEFAHTVYRFGHSMLTDTVDRLDNNLNIVGGNEQVGLIEAFLNPQLFTASGIDDETATGALVRGLSRQVGNEIDEFVVEALRNNLLGLPLDLPALNIARGRDTGIPSLNETRSQIYEMTGAVDVKPYTSWIDFSQHLKHPVSLLNFIAAYGTHSTIVNAATMDEKRDAALSLVTTGVKAANLTNGSFEADSLADGAPNVQSDTRGNYTFTAPTGWTLTGTGGVFAPAATVINPAGLAGTQVAWLGQDALLTKNTGQILAAGLSYRLTLDIGDRLDLDWPGGQARLVAQDGTVLASKALDAPANGDWSTVTFQTGPIAAAQAGQQLRIEIQQTGGTGNQILVDDVHLDVLLNDRLDFLNATGAYAGGALGGMNNIDLWIGGLAEELNEFGGQLGSTFNYIFEYQMEHLQNGDRFYYLSRTQGMNLLNLLEPNTFTDLVMRNTDLGDLHATHLPALLMTVPDMTLELDNLAGQENYSGHVVAPGADRSLLDPVHADPFVQNIDPKVVRVQGVERVGALDAEGKKIYDGGILKFSGGEHVVLGGTEGNDSLYGDKGIDTLWGDGGDDYLNAGMESDNVFGGDGDDIIEDPFGDNFLRGEAGHDVIVSDTGLSLLFGGEGQDFIAGVTDVKEVFAGPGNDFILGGSDSDVLMGNEGDDWIEGGEGFDGISGGNSELFFNSIVDGHDILNGQGNDTDYDGENGDDIMVDGPGIQRNNGMDGFDWTIFKGDTSPVDADLGIRPFETREALILRDRFDSVEGLSGWQGNDILTGAAKLLIGEGFVDALTREGVARIHNMDKFLNLAPGGSPTDVVYESDINAGGEIILGGAGSDTIRGNLGDDILDGDAWLNVRISVHAGKNDLGPTGPEIATFDSLTSQITWTNSLPVSWQAKDAHGVATGLTKQLSELMTSRLVNPGQLEAVREILTSNNAQLTDANKVGTIHDRDIAVFSDVLANYTIERDANGNIADVDGDTFITVAHTPIVAPGGGGGGGGGGAADSDGIDKIRNFEILSFADQNIFLDPAIQNTAATGLLNVTINPDTGAPGANVGDTFRVTLGSVADADGLPPLSAFTFSWEFEATLNAGDWEPVVDPVTGDPISGPTFTPTAAFELDGLRLRAIARFRDAEGVPEVVFSLPTAALAAQAVATATAGDDVLVGTNGADFINALAGDDTITALGGNDVVIGGAGSDIADGGLGTDIAVFFGPLANFTFELTPEGQLQVVDAATGDEDVVINFETLLFIDSPTPLTDAQIASIVAGDTIAGVTVVSQAVAELLDGIFINDDNAGNTLNGTEFGDVIFGNGGDDIIDGLGGDDLLVGGNGDDDIDSGGGNDIVSGGNSTAVGNTIRLRIGDETLLVGLNENGSDTVRNDGGTERLSIGAVAVVDAANETGTVVAQPGAIATLDARDNGAGDLVVTVNNKTVTITDHFNDPDSVLELVNFNGSTFDGINLGSSDYNLVAAATGVTTLNGGAGNDALFGADGNDTLNGNAGNDLLLGGAGTDTLNGGADNDILDGGAGADAMTGGTGDDIYVIDSNGDTVTEAAGAVGGVDTVTGARNLNLANFANVENITLTGSGAFTATGNGGDNVLTGNAGNNTLNGGLGTDTAVFEGTALAASFALNGGNVAVTTATGGTDTLQGVERVRFTSTTYNLVAGAAGIQTLGGTAGDDLILGFGGADTLNGLGGNDVLDGGAGNDTMTGGTGDDTYIVDGAGDIINEGAAAGDGVDTVAGALNLSLASYANVENVTLLGTGNFNATGNGGDNVLTGNAGTNILTGGAGNDTYVVGAGDSIVEAAGAAGGIDTATGERNINLNNAAFANVENITLLGTGNFNGVGNNGDNVIIGNSGNNDISGNQGNDTIHAGGGNDIITWGVTNGGVSDGRDLVDGGTEVGAGDTFIVNGNNESETYGIYSNTDDWDNNAANGIVSSAAHAGLTGLAAGTEIVITRNTTGAVSNANIIAELTDVEEIVINTGIGTDVVLPVGDFNGTALNFNTITVNDGGGSTTVDLTGLKSRHHVAFHTNGNDDTMVGARPQDQIIPGGSTGGGGNGGGGNGGGGNGGGGNGGGGDDTVGNGAFQLTPSDVAALKNLVNGREGGEDNDAVGIRDLEGTGNNRAHPEYGSADQPFIRITDAHYGAYNPATGNNDINPLFAGLDPRAISNALGAQEAGTPTSAQNVNALFTAFGQYFDHGLDFLGKGGNGTIAIGGPGTGHAPGTDNPADLTRGTVDSIVDGVPQHLNKTSPFVDQNQAYGSNELVGQFLREGDGEGGFSGRLLAGGPDPSNPDFNLLPNLRELIQHHWENNTVFTDDSLPGGSVTFRSYFAGLVDANGVINQSMLPAMTSNFMGSGFALLLDTNPFINLLDHYVAGDGRANENIALTSIHTIWARNHNFHVEGLIDAGFTGTSEELFQAAKLINEVEYQRVVFTEFADHLLGGIKGDGDHGFKEYNPDVDARVSHEFATAAYRFGHSLINQTMTVLDAQGNPTSVPLFDAFLNPTNDPSAFPVDPSAFYTPKPGYEQLGINGILGGAMGQAAEEVDVNIVDAVRNDLVRISADVFAFDVAREWDVGIGSMNQIRADLMASTDPYVHEAVGFAGDLSPYTSWEDFQTRNNLSDSVINQFKQAYPDLVLAAADIAAFKAINPGIELVGPNHDTVRGIDRVDLFVGGLAETHINGGVVGQTFWVILHEQLDRLQEGDRLYYLDRAENLDFYDIVEEQGFASIIARNTGLAGLPEDIFGTRLQDDEDDNDDDNNNDDDDDNDSDNDNDDDNDNDNGNDDDDDDDDDDAPGDDDDDQPGNGDDEDDDDGDSDPPPVVVPPVVTGLVLAGTAQTDVLVGGAGGDNLVAMAGDDVVMGNAGDDAISGGDGADFISGGDGRDVIFAGSGDDQVFGGNHADVIYGEAGSDRLFGDQGNDMITAGAGDDSVFGGAGNDLFVAEIGDGNDVYFGDDSDGGTGIDTLDMSAATADIVVNLGNGAFPKGSASSTQMGNDTIWGVENVNTGSGNDTIIASNAVNVMNGGAGNDTYRFMTAAAADGDTILGFAPGDRIDLSAIDANTGTAANDAFTLVTGAEFTAAGQLAVSFESRADGDYTIIQGNIDGNLDADFKIEVEGHHTINSSNTIV